MTYPFPPDLREIVDRHLATGGYGSEDELLREALRALGEEEEDLAAVRDAPADWHAGDPGLPLDDAFAALRRSGQATPAR